MSTSKDKRTSVAFAVLMRPNTAYKSLLLAAILFFFGLISSRERRGVIGTLLQCSS